MSKSLFVYGAGAIGRGFLPWIFPPDQFDYTLIETNPILRRRLQTRRVFSTFKTTAHGYEQRKAPIKRCLALGEEAALLPTAEVIVTAVGPRNVVSLGGRLWGVSAPILCFENDATLPPIIASLSGQEKVFFAIPDVITSNTASPAILRRDPLALVTEAGVCYIDEGAKMVGGDCRYVSKPELAKQWLAKLYLHNTPHCIAAYLGARLGVKYLHQAMSDSRVRQIVEGAMAEVTLMLVKTNGLRLSFAKHYAEKEIKRFANRRLFDPIERVAREPLRKLAPGERLVGAAQRCLGAGVQPINLTLGIMAAFFYHHPKDADQNLPYLLRALSPADFLSLVIQLRPDEALHQFLLNHWAEHRESLGLIK